MVQPTERRKKKDVQGTEVRKKKKRSYKSEKEIWRRRKSKSQTNKLGSSLPLIFLLGIENPKKKKIASICEQAFLEISSISSPGTIITSEWHVSMWFNCKGKKKKEDWVWMASAQVKRRQEAGRRKVNLDHPSILLSTKLWFLFFFWIKLCVNRWLMDSAWGVPEAKSRTREKGITE